MAYGNPLSIVVRLLAAIAPLCLGLGSTPGHAQQVRISRLTDVAFGTISNFLIDQTRTQNVCAHSTSPTRGYSVTARGNGTAFAFTLASGSNRLAYEVQWAGSTGQTTGTNLVANVAQTGFTGRGNNSTCGNGTRTASLITILRSTAISAATTGNYTGTLTLILAPI